MSLFRTASPKKEGSETTITADLPSANTVMGRKVEVLAALEDFTAGQCMVFRTEGKWSSHELLAQLLRLTGPAEVCISTYSMTEDPVRMLVNQLSTGQITKLQVICDTRFTAQQAAAHQLAKANFHLHLCHVHAKCMTISNDRWSLSVIGSANFTRNKRLECGVIIDDAAICAFNRKWIEDAGAGATG